MMMMHVSTRARTHAHTHSLTHSHTHTHARTHARTHTASTHTHTHARTPPHHHHPNHHHHHPTHTQTSSIKVADTFFPPLKVDCNNTHLIITLYHRSWKVSLNWKLNTYYVASLHKTVVWLNNCCYTACDKICYSPSLVLPILLVRKREREKNGNAITVIGFIPLLIYPSNRSTTLMHFKPFGSKLLKI